MPNTGTRPSLGIAILFLSAAAGGLAAEGEAGDRRVISLDGTWRIAEGSLQEPPASFDREVPVPGLVDLARPAFADVGVKSAAREAFWYRRTFRVDGPLPAVALIKVHKAMFGTRVVLNGSCVGDHLPCFTPGWFDARKALRQGENEIAIRIGAFTDSVPPSIPSGFDFEKKKYIPGIFDSVELVLTGTPHVVSVQAAPDIEARAVRVQVRIANCGPDAPAGLRITVREARSGAPAGEARVDAQTLPGDAERTLEARVPIAGPRLWSPEDPFLYEVAVDTGADTFRTRFGMREFRFDPASGRAVLNGRPYFLRGSNITLYRFFEDAERKDLPWREEWVRLLHRRLKEMHWNCLRYCIGFPPEAWYRIADEEGFLIQDEFPIWYGGTGWSKWPPELKREELSAEYAEWMRERWNHPCVALWDAQNETATAETGAAIAQVRALDLSGRPWDNGYGAPEAPGDSFESHPYHFQNPDFRLAGIAGLSGDPGPVEAQAEAAKRRPHAYVVNEYGWLWLNRDGTPTTLTRKLYENLLGAGAGTERRREAYARLLAAETEFWRARRKCAAVMHFCALGYSRPDGQTSDHWADVERLEWEPQFAAFVRDAFAPVGVMIDAWADEVPGGAREFPVVLINDLDRDWRGQVRFRLSGEGKPIEEKTQSAEVGALGSARLAFSVEVPGRPGEYRVEAELSEPGGETVRSQRDFAVVSEADRRARAGIAVGKRVVASSSIARDGATSPAAAADGRRDTRWSSEFSDPQWIAVDLGEVERVARVVLDWEAAHARAYAIEVSLDGKEWKEVYRTEDSKGGRETIRFAPAGARWVRLMGTRRATQYGYSLWELGVFPDGGADAGRDAWVPLFDGKTLEGWTRLDGKPIRNWTARDGTLVRTGSGGDIYTEKEYANFVLEFEWKLAVKGNSGVKYRMARYGGEVLGPEYQIYDDALGGREAEFTASIYDLFPARKDRKLRPPGEWNASRIVAEGSKIEHWLNGEKVVETDVGSQAWALAVEKSKFRRLPAFGRSPKGRIMLQDHYTDVAFRNIRIRELP